MTTFVGLATCVVIGDAACADLVSRAVEIAERFVVVRVESASDHELKALGLVDVATVVIAVHDDAAAVACAVAAAGIWNPAVLLVTVFDQTISTELQRALPQCVICSPGSIAAPHLAFRLLGPLEDPTEEQRTSADWVMPTRMRWRARLGVLAGQLRPHDGSTRLLYSGLLGLALVLLSDTLWVRLRSDLGWSQALFEATRVVTTVGPAATHGESDLYRVAASIAMLASLAFAAVFTAGLIERFESERRIGLLGRRVLPRSGHIIVVGLGQVGYRLCVHLRELGIPVIGVDRDPESLGARMSRRVGIPVLVGDGSERQVLESLGLRRAVALAAVSSSDSQNLAVTIAALGVDHEARVVGRLDELRLSPDAAAILSIEAVVNVDDLTADHILELVIDSRRLRHGGSQSRLSAMLERTEQS